jgi:hypothetical protein
MGLHSHGRLLALPTNISLEWKGIEVVNTIAYYDAAIITIINIVL